MARSKLEKVTKGINSRYNELNAMVSFFQERYSQVLRDFEKLEDAKLEVQVKYDEDMDKVKAEEKKLTQIKKFLGRILD